MSSVRTSSARARLIVVAASVLVAGIGAGTVLVLRLINSGFEPEGRNWWIVADTIVGLAYLPLGAALAVRRRAGLGVAFGVVGVCALVSALAAEWHANNASASGLRVIEHGHLVQTWGVGAVIACRCAAVAEGAARPMTRLLVLGVVAAWAGGLAALVERIGRPARGARRGTASPGGDGTADRGGRFRHRYPG